MSKPVLKAGREGPLISRISTTNKDKNQAVFTVEGLYEDLAAMDEQAIIEIVPDGHYGVESVNLTSSGNGMGVMTINCRYYDDPDETEEFVPVRTTFEVEMAEVQYDLEDHPALANARPVILMWLATDESQRVDGETFKYRDKNGDLQTIDSSSDAYKFCSAYMAGIRSFNRYFPVITKTSIWRNPPGLVRDGRSFTGGELPFSSCGYFEEPPISLNAYPDENYFKSKDSWVQNENKTWSRTEQWTFTPEGSDGEHAWIYEELD